MAVMIQVRHGEAVTPLQDGQGVTGIMVQPVQIVTRGNECSLLLLQTESNIQYQGNNNMAGSAKEVYLMCHLLGIELGIQRGVQGTSIVQESKNLD